MALKDLTVKMRLDNSQFKAGLKDSTKELDNMAKSASSMSGMLQLAGVAGFAMLGKQALSMAWDLGELGAQVDRTGAAFNELARQAGGSGEEMLNAIRTATRGTVSEMDMMAAANKGILLGLGADAQQWAQLTEVAMFRARAMGLTTAQALADITMGIGRESRLILDNLGIILDMDQVTQDYAATLGKTVDQLSAFERKQAIVTSVIKTGQDQIKEAGGIADDNAQSFERLNAAFADLRIELGEKLVPAVTEAVDVLTYVLGILGSDLPTALKNAALDSKAAGGGFEEMAEAARLAKEEMQDSIWGEGKKLLGIETKLTAEELIQLGEAAGATKLQVIDLAEEMGVKLPASFARVGFASKDALDAYDRVLTAVIDYQNAMARDDGGVDFYADIVRDAADAYLELSDASREAATGLGHADRAARNAAKEIGEQVGPVYNLAAAYDLLYENIAKKARARITGEDVWGFESMDPYESAAGQLAALDAVADQVEDNADRAEELAESYTRAWNKAYDEQEQRLRDLRSTIESALSPTSVTALDMFQTEQGTYQDKWDENARRASAIAQGGFGELAAHPDWAAALKIPPEILSANEDVLKEWAAGTSDQIRNLMRPDLLNVDAAVAAVKQSMQDAAARELSIDLIANAMIAEGTLNAEDAKKQVAQALGLDQTLVGEQAGAQMMDGLKASMEASNPAAQFAGYVQKNTEANTALLRTTGENLWHVINIGIDVAMKHTEYAKKLASIIAPEVAQILQERGVWGGTTP